MSQLLPALVNDFKEAEEVANKGNKRTSQLRKFIINNEQYNLLSNAKVKKPVNASISPNGDLFAM